MLVQDLLSRSAQKFPDKQALVAGSRRLTWKELDQEASRFAHALLEAGIEYQDRIAVILDNSAEAVISIWGVLRAGGTFVVINSSTKGRKTSYILNNCRVSAVVTHRNKLRTIGDALKTTPSLKAVFVVAARDTEAENSRIRYLQWDQSLSSQPDSPPDNPTIDIDLAALIYTSGTTGNPKGVMLTHRNIIAASTSITTYLKNTADDIILSVLPLSFDYGLYQALMTAQFGGTLVLEKSFAYPFAIVEQLQREKVTGFPVVPTIASILLQMKELQPETFAGVRYVTNTAAALPERHIRGLQTLFCNADIYSMYGLTECKRVSYLPPGDLSRKPTSVGKGMPNVQVYLVDENGEVIRTPHVVGELVVRGANVMKGYWELPRETSERLKPGRHPWERVLHTGDLFRLDEEGYLYFVSRKDDIIKSRGEKVSPKEVEAVLYEVDDVTEAAVVGVPDSILGEAIKAYIVLKPDSAKTEKEILAHCRRNLEDFMIPSEIIMLSSLPKTSTGKITKKDL